ncbi:Pyridoxine/pyridoxamine 5'-phosphate oxidase [Streptomyces netropsis]|nr:Pyridoxine/pyridoxamine 5'-phosphate oxidase [Streptomyces netropsis]
MSGFGRAFRSRAPYPRGRPVLQDGRVSHADDLDPAAMRAQYRFGGLLETDLADSPYGQFARWFAETVAAGLHEPNAMVVSTADAAGRPSSRTVLMKSYDERGFVFYTNYGSRKAVELAVNPNISLLFPWHPIARQVIVTGTAERVGPEETAAYFRSRPHGSQLGALASAQSTVVSSRAEIDEVYERLAARYPEGEPVPVPTGWGGFRVTPQAVEFWQGRENRLHDRLRYLRAAQGPGWRVERLCP